MSNLLESDYELIRRLQAFSANLFIHSMRVSMMSMRVSQKMGYNSLLAKAGGMYHEIGRIKKEENYVEATNDIAYAYDFQNVLPILYCRSVIRMKSLRAGRQWWLCFLTA